MVSSMDTILSLKQKLEYTYGFPVASQILKHSKFVCEDDKTFEFYETEEDATFVLIIEGQT